MFVAKCQTKDVFLTLKTRLVFVLKSAAKFRKSIKTHRSKIVTKKNLNFTDKGLVVRKILFYICLVNPRKVFLIAYLIIIIS